MLTHNTSDDKVEHAAPSERAYPLESFISFGLVLFAVAFNLYFLYPEVAGGILDSNDMVLHRVLADAAVETLTQGQDFTDPWEGTMGMGFPLLHYYQHLPHLSVALVHVLTLEVFPLVDMLHWTTYLLLSLFPLSIYWSLRRFGFDRISSAMGGLVSLLLSTNEMLGFSYSSYVFVGWGLYTQLWGMVLLPPAIAVGYQVMREGRGYFWATLLLAATLMSHLLYGYMAFLTLGILTITQPVLLSNQKAFAKETWKRWRRLIILLLLVVVVTSYFLVPLLRDFDYFNDSIWLEPGTYDSWGHSVVLSNLVRGDLYDFDRFPSLTYLVFAGIGICLFRWREERYLIPVAIFFLWLLLFFGRATWGPLIDLLPMSDSLRMRRFIGGVHLGGIFLMAVALSVPWHWALSRRTSLRLWRVPPVMVMTMLIMTMLVMTTLVLLPVYSERISYLNENALALREQQTINVGDQDFSALLEKLKQLPPGRVYAGPSSTSNTYYVRRVDAFDLLYAEGLDVMGAVYHGYSLNSDVLVHFDDNRLDHYELFNVRYVLAPEWVILPEFVKPLRQIGRQVLYQVETTGYFDLVSSDLTFAGAKTDIYAAASNWLASPLPSVKQHPVVSIGDPSQETDQAPLSAASDIIARVSAIDGPSRGTVLSEQVGSNYFAANVAVERESMLLLKATYHPNWQATVDGIKTDTVMLMPSFVGIQLPPGVHNVRIEYRSSRLRLILLGLGLVTLPLIAVGEGRARAVFGWLSTVVVARISVNRRRSHRRRHRRGGR